MALQISNNFEQLSNYFSGDFETIKKKIYDYNIKNQNKISYKLKDNMMLIFNDFVKNPTKDQLFNHSRSIVLSLTLNGETGVSTPSASSETVDVTPKYKIVAYTHPIIDYNNQGKLDGFKEQQFVECYEGTLISVYNCNGVWNYSTRKCFDAKDSHWSYNGKVSTKSHYDMFVESVSASGSTLEAFESNLDTTKSYYFVLVHFENKTFVDYSTKFGAEYKKLFLLFARDAQMNQTVDYSEYVKSFVDTSSQFSLEQVKQNIVSDTNVLGYLINDNGQFNVYYTNFYDQLERAAPYASSYENMLLELYKRNNLDDHFKMFPENVKYKGTNFDTKGVMYGVFTYMSMSLLNLYYFYTSYDGVKLIQKNPVEFKQLFENEGVSKNNSLQGILYKMKGMVLGQKKKLELADVKKMLKYYINSQDILRCLKELEEVKKSEPVIFKKMNPKYNENAIVKEFINHL